MHDRTATAVHETSRDPRHSDPQRKTREAHKPTTEETLNSGKVTNWKEMQDIQNEIEALGRQRSTLDERILNLMDQIETRRTAEKDTEAKSKAADAALAAKQAEYKATAQKLARHAQAL